jgi:predicted kinase
MEEKKFQKIFSEHKKILNNLETEQTAGLVICFAGIPGSGKTTIAKELEKKYNAVRINSEDLGKIVKRTVGELPDGNTVQNNYQIYLLENWPFANKLVIVDSGIERRYEKVLDSAKKSGLDLFVIRLDVSENILRRRIQDREGKNAPAYFNSFDRWKREFKSFKDSVEVDFVLDNGGELEMEALYELLDERLKN